MIFVVRSAGALGCAALVLLTGCSSDTPQAVGRPSTSASAGASSTPTRPARTHPAPLVLAPSGPAAPAPSGGLRNPDSRPSAPAPRTAARPSTAPVRSRPGLSAQPAPPAPGVDPLTGRSPVGAAPVVALKVDNGPLARRYQRGLAGAAVVYQELIEGSSTRLVAVYDNGYRGEVGQIRSVREGDAELLGQHGSVALGFSGGNTGVKAGFRSSVRRGRIFDASYDRLPRLYRLGEQRADARNFFTTPARLAAAVPGATRVRPTGLRFGPVPGGSPVRSATASFARGTTVRVRYLPADGVWQVFQDGRQMVGYTPTNVVVQQVRVRASRYADVLGSNSPFTVTIGSGPVSVLRGGLRVDGRWQRANVSGVTRYLDARGGDLRLKPGPTLILLVPTGRALTVG